MSADTLDCGHEGVNVQASACRACALREGEESRRRIADLEIQLAESVRVEALNVEALDAELDRAVSAEAQRDQLADHLKELVKSTRKAIGPKSVRHAIRQPMWGKLWKNIHAADELLAELEGDDA